MSIYRGLDSMPKHITKFAFKDMIENSVKLSIPNLDCVFFFMSHTRFRANLHSVVA